MIDRSPAATRAPTALPTRGIEVSVDFSLKSLGVPEPTEQQPESHAGLRSPGHHFHDHYLLQKSQSLTHVKLLETFLTAKESVSAHHFLGYIYLRRATTQTRRRRASLWAFHTALDGTRAGSILTGNLHETKTSYQ